MIKIFFSSIAGHRRTLLLLASAGVLALSSCATANSPSQPSGGGSGPVSTLRISERNGRVTIAGSARPAFRNPGNHVDIELLSADGRVVARKVERIALGHPRGSRARHGRDPFVAGFPAELFRQAAGIRVTLHGGAHANCAGVQS